ncbi:chord-domain-containing protein [Radiomyces spectabilis]|uniref:chord-domain-containing protein n=1 Tax=Radiomyces spectabilis TaxID=64574 RepID=UPI00221FD734|nr:chord-domain-containing protein [Radiomyces spectabilis]KAI8372946.1 chord-domain-containing protein [Radiomyces spectabilis]
MPKCTHKGCGKEFNPDDNIDNSCQFHPGAPIFHEGLKGWSCCNKRVSDFDEFLQIPGCHYGRHSTEAPVAPKPTEEPKQAAAPTATTAGVEVYGTAKQQSETVATAVPAKEETKKEPEPELEDDETIPVAPGTTCKRRGCGVSFKNNETSRGDGSEAVCVYHPGVPIFHEGSKGWSCCPRKVLEFDEFLKIKGCKQGKHLFVGNKKESDQEEMVDCRTDWYQTQSNVILSIFAKNKESTDVKFTSRSITIDIKMKNNQRFKKTIQLFHLIEPENSKFTALSTKVEINMKKVGGISWAALEPTSDVKSWTTFGVTGGGGTIDWPYKESSLSAAMVA